MIDRAIEAGVDVTGFLAAREAFLASPSLWARIFSPGALRTRDAECRAALDRETAELTSRLRSHIRANDRSRPPVLSRLMDMPVGAGLLEFETAVAPLFVTRDGPDSFQFSFETEPDIIVHGTAEDVADAVSWNANQVQTLVWRRDRERGKVQAGPSKEQVDAEVAAALAGQEALFRRWAEEELRDSQADSRES